MRPIFTKLLGNKQSRLSQHLKTAYPATLELRKPIRAVARDIIVHPGEAHAGTVGTAFDFLSGFLLINEHVPLNPGPTRGWSREHAALAEGLTQLAHDTLPGRADEDYFYQAIWVLAELGAIVRSGYSNPAGRLERVLRAKCDAEALLGITPEDGVRQLRELESVATENLYPHLPDPISASVSFDAVCEIVQAEADIIAGDMLLDYKTAAGPAHKTTGARAYFPTESDIYQILGYSLMDDPEDGHGIAAAGIYAARYGHSSVWELPHLLRIISGGAAISLDAARDSFRLALEADFEAAQGDRSGDIPQLY